MLRGKRLFTFQGKSMMQVWLKATSENSIVLSGGSDGNLIPMFAVRQVFFGHYHETAQAEKKVEASERFFKKSASQERITFLKDNHISYLFFGPEERGEAIFNPDEETFLKKVYRNGPVAIYKVI